jgi:N-acetylneuraminic acid mutarotase
MAGACHAADSAWVELPPLPEPNGGFVCGVFDDQIVVVGGTRWEGGTKHWLDAIRVFDVKHNTWRDAGRLAAPLAYAAAGQSAQSLWFSGGTSGIGTHTSLWMLGRDFEIHAVGPTGLHVVSCASALLDGGLVVIGGLAGSGANETATNACHLISTSSGKSRRIAHLPASSLISAAAVACGGRVFVFGGARWDAASKNLVNVASTFAWSAQRDAWETLAPGPLAVRGAAAIALDEHRIYLAGGYLSDSDSFTAAAHVFDTRTGDFRAATPLPYRAMATLVKCGGFLYCLGGEDQKQHRTSAVWRIRIEDTVP